MNETAKAFWSMYFINLLKREELITHEEYAELVRKQENTTFYNKHVARYNFIGPM